MFRWKTRCFEFYSTENIFWLVGNEIELLWALYCKNQRFCFFLATTHCTQLYVLKASGLFAVKLCVLQWYCTGKRFSFSLQRVRLIFPWFYSKRRFYLCLAKLRCSTILLLRTTFSSSFVSKLHIWRSILPEKCFGLLPTKLGCFEPYVTENSVFSLLCLKYVAFSFIAGKTCFGLFCRNSGLFPALLQRKKVFSQFAASHADFYLILLNKTFSSLSG